MKYIHGVFMIPNPYAYTSTSATEKASTFLMTSRKDPYMVPSQPQRFQISGVVLGKPTLWKSSAPDCRKMDNPSSGRGAKLHDGNLSRPFVTDAWKFSSTSFCSNFFNNRKIAWELIVFVHCFAHVYVFVWFSFDRFVVWRWLKIDFFMNEKV